jgi:hypothetical protein
MWTKMAFNTHSSIRQQEKVPEKNVVEFQVDDLVLVQSKHRKHKLEALWEGPYEVEEIQLPNFVIQRVGKRKRHTIYANLVKPFCSQERQDEGNSPVDCRN